MSIIARLPRKAIRLSFALSRRQYVTGWLGSSPNFKKFVRVSEEVQEALRCKAPVVALESAHLTSRNAVQGLPYPDNVDYSCRVEDIIREMGAVPAMIAVIDGLIRIGVKERTFEVLARSPNHLKVSSRDLPLIMSMERVSGGCTLAATVAVAKMVGIKVMAAGGIGGVHRSHTLMMDISADLNELGRSNVAVVCSGPRVYLDAVGTVEYLETKGVTVASFGDRNFQVMLPAYYSREGRIESPIVVKNAEEAAKVIYASHSAGLECGQLFYNPIPYQNELNIEKVEKTVRLYFKAARKKNKRKKEDMPKIIDHLRAHLGEHDRAIKSEKRLLLDNARMGAAIAIELSKLEGGPGTFSKGSWNVRAPVVQTIDRKRVTRTWTHRVWTPTSGDSGDSDDPGN